MNGYEYIETKRIIPKKIVDQNQIEINYLYASLIYYEYINALNELIEFDNTLKYNDYNREVIKEYNDRSNILTESEINYVENNIVKYYVLYSRMINLACEACESYSRAILLDNNEPFKNIVRKYAHNLFDMYGKLKTDYEDEFCDITEQEERELQTLSPVSINEQINIRSRYPGEFMADDNSDVVLKLLEDIRNISFLCSNKEEKIILDTTYTKNKDLKITEKLRKKYLDEINLMNSELMTEELLGIINTFGYEYIFSTKQKDEQEKINTYTLRSRIIKKSCDVYEHSSIYLKIKEGKTWGDYLDSGHNLRKIFYLLEDEEQLSFILETLFNFESLEEQTLLTEALINSNPEDSNTLLQELIDKRFIDRNGLLNLSRKQTETLLGKTKDTPEDIRLENMHNTIEVIFSSDAIKRLNNIARIPGNYYINYNVSVVVNMSLAMANEAFVIEEYKQLRK